MQGAHIFCSFFKFLFFSTFSLLVSFLLSFYSLSDDGVVIAISAAKFEPRNFWTGSWRAVWRVSAGGAEAVASGSVRINVHFYEDGNVQLSSSQTLEARAKAGPGAEATATALFKAIAAAEAKFQQNLEASHAAMDTGPFKALRRQLPVTGTKIDWDKIGNAKMGIKKEEK